MKEILVAYAWPISIAILLVIFRRDVNALLTLLKRRVSSGDSLKLGQFELPATRIETNGIPADHSGIQIVPEDFAELYADRRAIYDRTHKVMLVHRLFRSLSERHLFDVEIYCMPHMGGSLLGVQSVTYCFGSAGGWNEKAYRSRNRYNGFSVTTSAYGPMLCVARVEMSDGETFLIQRYVDFEMGASAKFIENIEKAE